MGKSFHIYSIPALLLLFALSACFKEDDAVTPHQPGAVITASIPLGPSYARQIFYNLSDSSIVLDIDRYSWDLTFSGANNNFHIRPNTSRFMQVAQTASQNFDRVYDPENYSFSFDASSGNTDSLVFKNWFEISATVPVSKGEIYLLQPGADANGIDLPLYKVQFSWIDSTHVGIRYGLNNANQSLDAIVALDPERNYTGFSFQEGRSIICEPKKEDWDLYFGQYSTILFTDEGEPWPYLLTGALINPLNVKGEQNDSTDFDNFSYEQALELPMNGQQDVIGYSWKEYDFDAGTYTVDANKHYIVEDSEQLFYILRFIGFSSPSGEKGWPTFEYRKL